MHDAPPKHTTVQEIERKYLIPTPPRDLATSPHAVIRQGYVALAEDGTEVRVREKGDRFSETVKRGDGLVRHEVEVELDRGQFEALWPLTEGRRLEKTRYDVSYGQYTVEVDVYQGRLEGLVVAEVEFASEAESRAFTPPSWFGDEVTGDARFKNRRLAVEGLPRSE